MIDLKAEARFGTTKLVVTVDYKSVISLFGRAMQSELVLSEGKDRTLYATLAYLVGISDAEAVKKANESYPDNEVTVEEFRKWLPGALSKFFQSLHREGETRQEVKQGEGWR